MSRADRLLAHSFAPITHSYSTRDTILYALGCGAGAEDLDLVYEPGLRALPSMAAVLAYPGNWYADPSIELDPLLTVHASERVELAGPLPVAGRITARPSIVAIHDKGPGRGAIVVSRRELREAGDGRLLATVTQRAFCRGDGGVGEGSAVATQPAPAPTPLPEGPPDRVVSLPTSTRAAAIYRLLGDDNPLHIDPDFARRAGFSGPILHGLASYGHIARAVLRDAPDRWVRVMDCRFMAPVLPGETLELDLWDLPDGRAFRARVGTRVVVDNGEIDFGPTSGSPISGRETLRAAAPLGERIAD